MGCAVADAPSFLAWKQKIDGYLRDIEQMPQQPTYVQALFVFAPQK